MKDDEKALRQDPRSVGIADRATAALGRSLSFMIPESEALLGDVLPRVHAIVASKVAAYLGEKNKSDCSKCAGTGKGPVELFADDAAPTRCDACGGTGKKAK